MILLWTISRLQIAIWMGQSTNVREGNNYKTHYSTQLTSKLSGMGCLLSWSWYGYAIQLGQLERLRFCLSKFCIPGLGEFLACEESLSPSKEGGSPSNVSESESESGSCDEFQCKSCDSKFKQKKNLTRHEKMHKNDWQWKDLIVNVFDIIWCYK